MKRKIKERKKERKRICWKVLRHFRLRSSIWLISEVSSAASPSTLPPGATVSVAGCCGTSVSPWSSNAEGSSTEREAVRDSAVCEERDALSFLWSTALKCRNLPHLCSDPNYQLLHSREGSHLHTPPDFCPCGKQFPYAMQIPQKHRAVV
ncbi:hypothetical protein EYF80_017671 [Liparis tanakae]|uniref:Uncharacterized protein n=1 Tax=Liparis tanakae TaxID=230148 RepID=A0A4Z2I458_9TELE|nr:hypothetical protein EYF80_017671 [Liparis tanakae]